VNYILFQNKYEEISSGDFSALQAQVKLFKETYTHMKGDPWNALNWLDSVRFLEKIYKVCEDLMMLHQLRTRCINDAQKAEVNRSINSSEKDRKALILEYKQIFGELTVKQRLEFKAYKVDKELEYEKLADWGCIYAWSGEEKMRQ